MRDRAIISVTLVGAAALAVFAARGYRESLAVAGVSWSLAALAWHGVALLVLLRRSFSRGGSDFSQPVYLFVWSIAGVALLISAGWYLYPHWREIPVEYWIARGSIFTVFLLSANQPPIIEYIPPKGSRAMYRTAYGALLALTAAAVLLLGGERLLRPVETRGPMGVEFDTWFQAQPRIALPFSPEGAAVLFVKVNDYQCPACRAAHQYYAPLLQRLHGAFNGGIREVLVDYPLEPECNPHVQREIHAAACEAAVAVRLAGRQGLGEAMANWLWENQARLTPVAVAQAAREVGRVPDFEASYPGELDGVRGDAALAHALGVRGTPTFFVNGVKLRFIPAANLERALLAEIQKGQRGTEPQ